MSLVTGQRNACLVLMLSPMESLSITVQRSHLMDINAQLSSRARVPIPVLIPIGCEFVLYSITKHAMRRSADEIGAASISFRPKVFSDATIVDGIFFRP